MMFDTCNCFGVHMIFDYATSYVLEIDNENNVWITDVGLHQQCKYDSNDKRVNGCDWG